jgi:hypothetical protein
MPLLQRKCACGGGCPRCKEELGIQTKLKISEPGDKYEQQADRVADEVMRMPESLVQRQVEPEEEEMVHRKAIANPNPLSSDQSSSEVPPIVHEVLNSPGQPLDPKTRTFMESRFGHDFSQVRVHTDVKAVQSARSLNALAYTVGQNIVFGSNQYALEAQEGKRLLAHELTHVVQQNDNLRSDLPLQQSVDRQIVQRLPSQSELDDLVIHQNGMGIYASPNDDILDIEPIAVLPRGTTIRILDDSDPLQVYVEVVDGSHIGVRGYLNNLGTPYVTREQYQSLEDLLNFNSPRGWHRSLPRSTLRAGSIDYQRGRSRGETPSLSGSYPDRPSFEPRSSSGGETAEPIDEAMRRLLIGDMRRRLVSIPIPTQSSQMPIYRGGYAYRAGSHREGNETSEQQYEFIREATLESIGLDSSVLRVQRLWQQFQRVMRQEGDTSAINAWDDQIVSIGAGFSARLEAGGDAGAIYNDMPSEFRQRLYEHGIYINDDNSFTVLDLERGVVETGENALRILQVNPHMLALLIQEAQSERELTQGDTTMSQRAWMLRAQFERFMIRNQGIPNSVFSWPENAQQFAFKLKHWSGALTWTSIADTGGGVERLANYALRTVYRVKAPDRARDPHSWWTEENIRNKIIGIGERSGVSLSVSDFRPVSSGE